MDTKQTGELGVNCCVIQGRFGSDQPLKPLDPFEPLNPWKKRPIPQRPFQTPENISNEFREPFVDVFEEEKAVRIYIELPFEKKNDIKLNITRGRVEVKTKNFYKIIDVPENIDIKKASLKYNNTVLTISIPKTNRLRSGYVR